MYDNQTSLLIPEEMWSIAPIKYYDINQIHNTARIINIPVYYTITLNYMCVFDTEVSLQRT